MSQVPFLDYYAINSPNRESHVSNNTHVIWIVPELLLFPNSYCSHFNVVTIQGVLFRAYFKVILRKVTKLGLLESELF